MSTVLHSHIFANELRRNHVKRAKASSTLLRTLPELFEHAIKIGDASSRPYQWQVAVITASTLAEQLSNATLPKDNLDQIKATAQTFMASATKKLSRPKQDAEVNVQICRACFVLSSWLAIDVPEEVSSSASALLQYTLQHLDHASETMCTEYLRLLSFQLSQAQERKSATYAVLLAVFLEFAKRHTTDSKSVSYYLYCVDENDTAVQQAFAEALIQITSDDFASLQTSFDMTLADWGSLEDVPCLLQASTAILSSAPEGTLNFSILRHTLIGFSRAQALLRLVESI